MWSMLDLPAVEGQEVVVVGHLPGAVGHLLSASSVTKQSPVKIILGLLGALEGLLREMEEVVVVTLLHFHMIMVGNDLPRYA